MIKRGIDIISRRFSAFEKEALKEILDLKKDDLVYELGAGRGNFSIILSFLNKKIISLDIDFEKKNWKLLILKKIFQLENWKIKKSDISKMNYVDFQDNISFVFAGRFFHYLNYEEGEKLLKILSRKMKNGAKIYFSISGIDSDLAKNYLGKEKKIENRFEKISPELRKRFKIKKKVCLYSEKEVKELFEKYFKIVKIEKTAFNNINIIAKK